jgi:hypothetical protein
MVHHPLIKDGNGLRLKVLFFHDFPLSYTPLSEMCKVKIIPKLYFILVLNSSKERWIQILTKNTQVAIQ